MTDSYCTSKDNRGRRIAGSLALGLGLALVIATPYAEAFTYLPPGDLIPGSGTGQTNSPVYITGMRYPVEMAPSYANSQVYRPGGSHGGGGSQCDSSNYSYPWRDNFCETRGNQNQYSANCPAYSGIHQGQDIRAATCVDNTHWVVATESGRISHIGSYSVYLEGDSGIRHRFLHMEMNDLAVVDEQIVSKGQRLGKVSNDFGGASTTYHLHFDMKSGHYLSPYMTLVRAYEDLLGPPTTPEWFLRDPQSTGNATVDPFFYGDLADNFVVGDWNNDGKDTPGVFRNGEWHLRNTNTTGAADLAFWYGNGSDTPVVGDWNGDGIDTVGVFRNGNWLLRNSNTTGNAEISTWYGIGSDIPVPGDWNGDGNDQPGVYRPSERAFYRQGQSTIVWGNSGDLPFADDWNGDGIDEIGLYRPSNNMVFLWGGPSYYYGDGDDIPVAGDWDGNGISSIGIVRVD